MVFMRLAGALRLFACKSLWRTTGLHSAGRALIHALASKDDTQRTIAGMFLIQAGKRAERLLREAIEKRENLPMVLMIVGDIGDRTFEPELRRFLSDSNPEVAEAARQALRILAAHKQPDSPLVQTRP